MKFTERTDIRCFTFLSSLGEVNIFVSPITEELINRGCEGIKGYIFEHMSIDGVAFDMDDDFQDDYMEVLHEIMTEEQEEEFNGDVCGMFMNCLPL